MSDFKSAQPESSSQLYEQLLKLHKNRSHIESLKVNGNRIECDLDSVANGFLGRTPDFYILVKDSKIGEARIMIERFMSAPDHTPTMAEAEQLYKLLGNG